MKKRATSAMLSAMNRLRGLPSAVLLAALVACGSRTNVAELDGRDASPTPTTTSTTPAPQPTGRYVLSAFLVIGGLDRIVVCAEDRDTDVAYQIWLVHPTKQPSSVDLPEDWGVEAAQAVRPARLCRERRRPADAAKATGTEGSISFMDRPYPPRALDVDVSLDFAATWVPRTVVLKGTGVPISD